MTKKQWGILRASIYALSSAILKYAGIKGWVEDNEGQALLLIISAVLDMALIKVDLGSNPETTEEFDTGGDTSL